MVKLYASKGDLEILVPEKLTTNAINAYEVHFSFDEDWEDFSKIAVFYQTQRGKRYTVALYGDKAYIPAELLQVGLPIYVGLVGQKGDVKKNTKYVKLEIDEGADSKGTVTFVQTTDTKIAFIRLNDGIFEYSTDGATWEELRSGGGGETIPTVLYIDDKAVPRTNHSIKLETDETLDFDEDTSKLGLSEESKAKFTDYTEKTDSEITALKAKDTAVDKRLNEVDSKLTELGTSVRAADEKADKNATDIAENTTAIVGHTADISKNAENIAKNASDIATLKSDKFDKNGGAISGDVSISGDLNVAGTTTTEHATQLFVDKPIIAVNGKKVDLKTILAGLAINKDETATYGLVYDATTDTVRFGIGTLDEDDNFAFNDGEGMPLAIRADSADFTDLHLVKWNASKKAFEDAGASVADIQKDYTDKIAQAKTELSGEVSQAKTDLQGNIDQVKSDLQEDITQAETSLQSEIAQAKTESQSNLETAKTELQGEINTAKADLQGSINTTKSELQGNIDQVQSNIDQTKADLQAEIVQTKNDIEGDISQASTDLKNNMQVNRMELVNSVVGEYREGVGVTVQGTGEIEHADGTKDTFAGEIDIPLSSDKQDVTLENTNNEVVIKGVEYIEITDGNGTLSEEAYTKLTAKKGNAIIYDNEIYRLSYNASTENSWVYSVVGGNATTQYVKLLSIDTTTKEITFTQKNIGESGVKSIKAGTGNNAEVFNGVEPSKASGDRSHAEGMQDGDDAGAKGLASHVEGESNLAKGEASHAEGHYNEINENGIFAHAEGEENHAQAKGAHVEGYANYANAPYSHVEGQGNVINGYKSGQHAEGRYCDETVFTDDFDTALSATGNGYYDENYDNGDGTKGKVFNQNAFVVRENGDVECGNATPTFNDKTLTPYKWVNTQLQNLLTQINGKTTLAEVKNVLLDYVTNTTFTNTLKQYVTDDELNKLLESYVKAGDGKEIVNGYQLEYNKALELEPNSLYIIQGYDNSYNLADFKATGGSKDITSDMAVVVCGGTFDDGTLDSLIVAKTGTITTSVSTASAVTTITPTKSTIYLKYWRVKGLTIGGAGGGTEVVANPPTVGTTPLEKLRVENATYTVPTITPNTEDEITENLETITINGKTYFVGVDTAYLIRHNVYAVYQLNIADDETTPSGMGLILFGQGIASQLDNYLYDNIETFPIDHCALTGFLVSMNSDTDDMMQLFIGKRTGWKVLGKVYKVEAIDGDSGELKVYYTAQNITYDGSEITAIEVSNSLTAGKNDRDYFLVEIEYYNDVDDVMIDISNYRTHSISPVSATSLTNEKNSAVAEDVESANEYEVLVDGESIGTVSADDDKGGAE